MQFSRYAFAILGVLLVVGIVIQVFLAGLFLFAGSTREWHINFGYLLELPPLLLLVLAWPARIGRSNLWLAVGLAVDVFVQSSLPYFKGDLPIVAALHPVNALLVLWLAVTVATRGVALARGAAPATAVAAMEGSSAGRGS